MTDTQVWHDRAVAIKAWDELLMACRMPGFNPHNPYLTIAKTIYLDQEYPLKGEIREREVVVRGSRYALGSGGRVDCRVFVLGLTGTDARWLPSEYALLASLATLPCETQINGEWVPCDALGKVPEKVTEIPEDVRQWANRVVGYGQYGTGYDALLGSARFILSLAEAK